MSRLRTRLPTLASVWAAAIVAEVLLYYMFLSRPYFTRFFTPFAVALFAAAVITTWRIVRPRSHEDRRHGERRHEHRRAGE
jgi:small-conductance mechanosensitive channel